MFSKLDGIKNVDIKFENTLTAEVAKYIVVKFETLIYYDRDISKTIQRLLPMSIRNTRMHYENLNC